MAGPSPFAPTNLDADQAIRGAFDEQKGRFRVETEATVVNGAVEVAINAEDDDIAIKDPSTGATLHVNTDGSINVNTGSSTASNVTITQGGNDAIVTPDGALTVTGIVTGEVTLAGLGDFLTAQTTIGLTAVQITPSPLTNRSSLTLRPAKANIGAIYIGSTSSVTTSSGYPLYSGDTLSMDLDATKTIFAIADTAAQILCDIEIA